MPSPLRTRVEVSKENDRRPFTFWNALLAAKKSRSRCLQRASKSIWANMVWTWKDCFWLFAFEKCNAMLSVRQWLFPYGSRHFVEGYVFLRSTGGTRIRFVRRMVLPPVTYVWICTIFPLFLRPCSEELYVCSFQKRRDGHFRIEVLWLMFWSLLKVVSHDVRSFEIYMQYSGLFIAMHLQQFCSLPICYRYFMIW